MERDGGCVARRYAITTSCTGALHPHHIWPTGRQGPDRDWNLATLCARHHRFVHDTGFAPLLLSGPPPGVEWSPFPIVTAGGPDE